MATDEGIWRLYARQEFMTPGAPETVAFVRAALRADRAGAVLEVACGKAEAACLLAAETGRRIVAVDLRARLFLAYAAAKVRARGVADRVHLVCADGTRLPFPDGVFAAGYCIGAPSLIGLEACLGELHRTVQPGGDVIVSDIVWRDRPADPLGPEWGAYAREPVRLSAEDYGVVLARHGFEVATVYRHPHAAWDAYLAPMGAVAAAARAAGDDAFAAGVERVIALERRAVAAFLDYATFVTRTRSPPDQG